MALDQHTRGSILALSNQGMGVRAIARTLHLHPSTVSRFLCHYREHGIVSAAAPSGRPRMLSERDERQVARLISSGECDTAEDVRHQLANQGGHNVSRWTISRALHRQGFEAGVKCRKPLLQAHHRQQRLEWALRYQHWTNAQWSKVLFSDETKINLWQSDGRQYCWRRPGEQLSDRCVQPTVKHGGGSIIVWTCMSAQGVGWMCRIEGNMNAELYTQILGGEMKMSANFLFPRGHFVFQHDNDSKHTARLTRQWLEGHEIKVLDWPAQSPDMNPMEHAFNELKRRLRAGEHPRNLDELWEHTANVWYNFESEYCSNLISTMPQRVQDLIQARGGHTRW